MRRRAIPHTRWWMCRPPVLTFWNGPTPARIRWVIARTVPNVSRKPREARNSRSRRSLLKWKWYSWDRNCKIWSAGEEPPAARAARDLVLDDCEVVAWQRVDMSLEGQGPMLGWPLAHVIETVGEVLGRNPITVLEHNIRTYVHAPRIVFIPARRAPDRGVILVHRRGDCYGGGECHPAGDVVQQPVAYPHRFHPASMAALEALDREAQLAGLAEVVRRADDHPVLRRPPFRPPVLAFPFGAAWLGSRFGYRVCGARLFCHLGNVAGTATQGPGAVDQGLAVRAGPDDEPDCTPPRLAGEVRPRIQRG